MFVGLVGKAMTHEQILADVAGNFNGALQIVILLLCLIIYIIYLKNGYKNKTETILI